MIRRISIQVISVLIIFLFFIPPEVVGAQATSPSGPVYIVQEGDTLWEIAYRFHVSQEALANANGISDANDISIGQSLIIPGLEGIKGILTRQSVRYGETLNSLSIRYGLSTQLMKKLNHITSPNEVYAGYMLIIPEEEAAHAVEKRVSLESGQSLLELAVLNGTSTWNLLESNGYKSLAEVMPGDVLFTIGADDGGPGGLPPAISDVSIHGLIQGQTSEIQVTGDANLKLSGSLMEHALNFYPDNNSEYVALQGVHAMATPGLYPLSIQGSSADGTSFSFTQRVMLRAGDFVFEYLAVDPVTLDPETNRTENELWNNAASPVNPEKMWSDVFTLPVNPLFGSCYPSFFGNRRSYNGSAYVYFHTGLDFCGQVGDPIYAAAPGVVVFAGELTVRGNATMIDHGRGIYTAYMHQSEIFVNVGDRVEQGQLIGKVGNTGRVEGPHLHFEVIVGGVQVNPLDWLEQTFP